MPLTPIDNKNFKKWIAGCVSFFHDALTLSHSVKLSILDTLQELSASKGEFVPVSKIVEKLNYESDQGTTSILLLCSSFDIVQYQVEKVEIEGQIKRKYSFAIGENFQSLANPNSKLHRLAKYLPTGNFESLPAIIRSGAFQDDEELRSFFLEISNLILSYCHRVDANENDEFTISFEERILFIFFTQVIMRIQRDALSYFGIPHLFYNLIESKETNDEDKQIKEKDLLLFITNNNEKTEYAKIFLEILVYSNWISKIEQNGEIYYKKGAGLYQKENCPKTFGPNQQSVSDLYTTFSKEFAKSITTGKSAVSFAFEGFDNFFEVLKSKPDLLVEYHQRTRLSTIFFANQAVRYDYSKFSSLIEIGGSLGYFILALLEKYPNSKGVVFDLPSVIEDAISQLHLVDESVSKRCEFVAGSFFDSVPVAPEPHAIYLIKNVLHDWVRSDQVKILKTVAAAMKQVPDSVLQIIEVYFDEVNIAEAARFDIHTLTCWGSSVLSFDDYRSILNEAGFEVTVESRIAPGVCAIDAKLKA